MRAAIWASLLGLFLMSPTISSISGEETNAKLGDKVKITEGILQLLVGHITIS